MGFNLNLNFFIERYIYALRPWKVHFRKINLLHTGVFLNDLDMCDTEEIYAVGTSSQKILTFCI